MKPEPRAVAAEFLLEVFSVPRHADALIRDRRFLRMDARDRRFAYRLVQGVLRSRGRLDDAIRRLSDRPLRKIDAEALWLLRIGIYQLEFLRVPERAAVHETVKLCRRLGKSSAAGFVNAVLRRFIRERPEPPQGNGSHQLAVRYSHPEWLVRRWLSRWGTAAARRLMERNNALPQPLLWVNPFQVSFKQFQLQLEAEGVAFEVFPDLPNCLKVAAGFANHRLYAEGSCFFMDQGSQEIVQQVDVSACRTAGDFCAAPGGKAFLLASRLPEDARLYCADASLPRLRRMAARARLMRIPRLHLAAADLSIAAPYAERFDFVLLDVPCSGLGTLGANPDIRWKIAESSLAAFQSRQLAILRNGFAALRRGGKIVYSTCTTEPEENEQVVEQFLGLESRAVRLREDRRNFPNAASGQCFYSALIGHAS